MKKLVACAGNNQNYAEMAEEMIADGAERIIILDCDCQWYTEGEPSTRAKFFNRNPTNTFKFCVYEQFCCSRRTRIPDEDLEMQIQEAIRRTESNRFAVVVMEELCDFGADYWEDEFYVRKYAHVVKFLTALKENGYEWLSNGYEKKRKGGD